MEQAKILVVDDSPHNLELLSTIFEEQNYEVRCVTSGKIALKIARSQWAELILLDIQMPEMNGYEVCQQLKVEENTKDIPVIFLSALDGALDKVRAFQAGGIDYITKPFQLQEVLIRVHNQLAIKKSQDTIKLLNKQLEAKVTERTAKLEATNKKLQLEIKQRKHTQEKLLKLALHDSVTGLPNRNSFLGKLKHLLLQYRKQPTQKFAVILIESDRFSEIKCRLDHLGINQLLTIISNRLQKCLPNSAILSRFEANEFAIILKQNTDNKQEIIDLVKVIQKQFNEPFTITSANFAKNKKQQQLSIKCSIGIVTSDGNYSAAYDVLRNAEIAVHQARKNKNSNYYFFLQESSSLKKYQNKNIKSLLGLAPEIKQLKAHFEESLNRGKFVLKYQPIFSLKENNDFKIKGLEVFQDRQINYKKLIVLTNLFEDIDESKLSIHINNFVLDYASLEIKELQQQHETQQNFFLAMQFTEKELLQPQLASQISQILENTQLAAKHLHLDIAGDRATLDNQQIISLIQQLSELEIKLNLDCSNLPYETIKNASRLPFNNFKIDGSLTSQITNQNEAENSLSAIAKIINLAHENKITVTAKDIETQEQLVDLKSVGCNYGQGDLLAQPLDIESLEAFLVWRI
ncbi:putative Response regulator receiver modulated diguanylate cyclase/phosphodiesterase [Hyella patelloides LEGE 07179]|uniref:Putative Response regulator receiver modulated diguanylate cyclase/phosphodiesterase n=1 Tax=Hyella patelloides LEGE 07179 TaxID=945734 RepID=A0A563VVR6_9CYAN|nr:EAL domain-containing protein [Hyella patelloides]VEP15506.1 putative Response regulator receiver modulated diguanylate cyclase/phosphodiesterase [Hyella patelloides LEGE 07179]